MLGVGYGSTSRLGCFIALMGTLAAVFAWVAMGASVVLDDYGPAIASAYRLRTWLLDSLSSC